MRRHRSGARGTRRSGDGEALERLADEELMGLVAEGDARAFEIVYDRHCGAAFSLAYRMCGRRGTAEEVLQDAFLALWRSGSRYDRTRGSVRNWILRIVHNRAVDAMRRGSVRERDLNTEEGIVEQQAGGQLTEDETLRRERTREVQGMLRELPQEQSSIIELAYFGGFTHAEIAAMLQMPIGTVKGRIRLGLAKLRIAVADGEGLSL